LEQLGETDFFLLIEKSFLIRFNNKGVTDASQKLHQELDEKLLQLASPPYYYSSVTKAYLKRFDSILEDNEKVRIFDSIKDENTEVGAEAAIFTLLEALPDAKANHSLDTKKLLAALEKKKAEFVVMDIEHRQIGKSAKTWAKVQMSMGLVGLVGYLNFVAIGVYYVWSWDVVEPLAYFICLTTSIWLATRYFKLRNDFENTNYHEYLAKKAYTRIAKKRAFDVQRYNKIKDEINTLRNQLKISMLIDL
jgi:Mitochondrial calcium uniporter